MERNRDIEFNASGVTIGDRQMIIRDMYRRLVKLAEKTPPPSIDRLAIDPYDPHEEREIAFSGWLRTIDVKLSPESDNKIDKYAIKVMVFSRLKDRWVQLGYVPQKYKLDLARKDANGRMRKGIPLNEVLHPLVDKGYVKNVGIVGLGSFTPYEEDGEPKVIYYLKIRVTVTLP